MNKQEIKDKYGCISYRTWNDVPDNLYSRTSLRKLGIKIPNTAKPDAIKNSSAPMCKDRIFMLFDINKYKTTTP